MNYLAAGMRALRQRWQNYWYGDGFWTSYGVCRIALGLLLLLTAWPLGLLSTDYDAWLRCQDMAAYKPIGILYLFGRHCPSATLFLLCRNVLRVSIPCVIVGFCSRLSLLATAFGMCCLCSLQPWAFVGHWCHITPVTLLPTLAMLVGPPSPLSLDSLIRRRLLGRPAPTPHERALARGPVLLAQAAVAILFANAGLYKVFLGNHEPLAWVYSDGMRNILILQYWKDNLALPGWIRFVASHVVLYKGMALANVVNQFLPLLACFLVRRPVLRALFGATFVLEAVGLHVVMGMFTLHWCILLAFFIDWDRLGAWLATRLGRSSVPAPAPTAGPLPRSFLRGAQGAWALVFLGFYLFVGLAHKEQRRFTFPFTAFPVYSDVSAEKPYGRHRPFRFLASRWVCGPEVQLSDNQVQRSRCEECMDSWQREEAVVQRVKDFCAGVEQSLGKPASRVELHRVVYEVAAYPDCDVRLVASGPVCQVGQGGMHTLVLRRQRHLSTNNHFVLELKAEGFTSPAYRLEYFTDDPARTRPLEGEWHGNLFHCRRPSPERAFVLVKVCDGSLPGETTFFGPELPEAK